MGKVCNIGRQKQKIFASNPFEKKKIKEVILEVLREYILCKYKDLFKYFLKVFFK